MGGGNETKNKMLHAKLKQKKIPGIIIIEKKKNTRKFPIKTIDCIDYLFFRRKKFLNKKQEYLMTNKQNKIGNQNKTTTKSFYVNKKENFQKLTV